MDYMVFLVVSFLAAIAATIAGFGSSTILIPVAVLFMDIKAAIFLVACFHLFNNTFKIRLFWNKIDWRTFVLFGVPSIACAFLGALAISRVSSDMLRKAVAIFLIVFSVYSLCKPSLGVKKTNAHAIIGGGLSGFLAGLIGLGGAIRSVFLVAFHLPKEIYVATSAAIAFVIDVTRIPTYIATDIVRNTSYYTLLPFLLLTAYLGTRIGKMILLKMTPRSFRTIVLIAILLVGVKLLFF